MESKQSKVRAKREQSEYMYRVLFFSINRAIRRKYIEKSRNTLLSLFRKNQHGYQVVSLWVSELYIGKRIVEL